MTAAPGGLAAGPAGATAALAPGGDSFLVPSIAIIGALFLGSALANALGGAAWLLAVFWLPAALYLAFQAPLHLAVRVFLLLALVLESADEAAGNGYWVPPLTPASTIFYYGLNRFTGISALSVSMFHLLAVALFVRGRRARRPRGYVHAPKEAICALAVLFFAVVTMELYGLARGGRLQPSFWQVIQPLCLPIVGLAFMYAVRGTRDLRALAEIVVCAAVTKGLLVVWVYEVVCRPLNVKPFFATTHSDSVTFDAALLILAAIAVELRDRRSVRRFILIGAFLVVAVVMNNRRLAFVGMVGGAAALFAYLRKDGLRKRMGRLVLVMSPFLAGYVVVGGHSPHPLFAPAALVVSIFEQKDRSSGMRDIENYNLITTMRQMPIVGPGLGFEYQEAVTADNIAGVFSLYRYIGHNSVLWLLSVGGYLWFVLIWMIYAVHSFFASRAYRLARTGTERAASLAAAAVLVVCLAQNWGDMGFHSYVNLMIFSVAFTVAAKVCALRDTRSGM